MITKVLISFILSIILAFSQAHLSIAQKNPKRLYIVDETKKQVRLPFKFINNLIIITVQINNSDTLNFILDTGITTTIICAKNLPKLDSLKYLKAFWVSGLGQGDGMPARHSPENDIKVHGIIGQHQDLLVIEESQPNLSNLLGIPIHGLIGYTLFKDFIVEINYDEHQLILHTPRKYTYNLKKKKQVTIPLTFFDSKPYIDALAVQSDDIQVPVKLLVDLGASHSIWFNLQSNPILKLPEKNTQVLLGVGLNGLISGRIGRLNKLLINRFEFQNIIANYPDTISLGNALKMDYRNGSIGAGLLSRFNIIMDYRNQKITLAPNQSIKQPFYYNMSGIEIEVPQPGVPIYQISYIRNNSPADRAGLQVGDQILYINSESVSKLTFTDIIGTFLERPGKRITIIYSRNGKERYTSFVLEEII